MKQHLESDVYSVQDIAQYEVTLQANPVDFVESTKVLNPRAILSQKFNACNTLLLELSARNVSDALEPVHSRLVEIKQALSKCFKNFNSKVLQELQKELLAIDSVKMDGKFISKEGDIIHGQGRVIDLLSSCFEDVHELLSSQELIDAANPTREIYESLISIKSQLTNYCSLPWTCSLQELQILQRQLGAIDNLRVDGKFIFENEIPQGQALLHLLLHKCYRLVRKLYSIVEPVDQELMPLYHRLSSFKKCLLELRKWNVLLDDQDLIPYQLKLASLQQEIQGQEIDVLAQLYSESSHLLATLTAEQTD
jgi:hypothetical protein